MSTSRARGLRILALVPPDGRGLRVTVAPLLRALARRHDVRFFTPTPGEPAAPVAEIQDRLFGPAPIDWIALSDHDQGGALPPDLETSPVPRLVWIDDAYVAPVERLLWLERVAPRLALFTQWRWARSYRAAIPGDPLWLPHGIEPEVFSPPHPETEREIDVLLYGRVDPRVYPFRTRLARLLERTRALRVVRVPHPGYGEGIDPERSLASLLRRSKVALVDGTRHGLLLRRYFEVPACGALAVGEIPPDYSDRVGRWVDPLSPRASDAAIIGAIELAVARSHTLEAFRRSTAELVLREESNDARALVLERELLARGSS